ncbi:hypothetical protein HQ394_13830 [Defluviicoccus vanus]|uniref:Uncharacterized protein n=1 Tax=Defluviicoccus vanus TaxID=111831 RepID=A0A7H1N3B9_9PROT|nr:hypothetical protein HQ394_13830 [Defluviicoccus vanus]
MRDYERLRTFGTTERLRYISGASSDIAIELAKLTLAKSLRTEYQGVLRVHDASGRKAIADWPLHLQIIHENQFLKPGWFIVRGELSQSRDRDEDDGLPVGTLTAFKALTCEQEGCSSPNDLIAMVRFRLGLDDWRPQ